MREITLRLEDDASFPALMNQDGVEVARFHLVDNGDGTYGLEGEETYRSLRKRNQRPLGDEIREMLNEFMETIEGEDLPPKLKMAVDRLYDRWTERVAPKTRLEGE